MRSVATREIEMREYKMIAAVNRVVLLRQLVMQLELAHATEKDIVGWDANLHYVIKDAKAALFAAESNLLTLRSIPDA